MSGMQLNTLYFNIHVGRNGLICPISRSRCTMGWFCRISKTSFTIFKESSRVVNETGKAFPWWQHDRPIAQHDWSMAPIIRTCPTYTYAWWCDCGCQQVFLCGTIAWNQFQMKPGFLLGIRIDSQPAGITQAETMKGDGVRILPTAWLWNGSKSSTLLGVHQLSITAQYQ